MNGLVGGRLHVAGAAGKGMAGVAMLAAQLGLEVSASDLRTNHRSRALEEHGVPFSLERDVRGMDGIDALAFSAGLPDDNPLRIAAREQGKPAFSRLQAVVELLGDRRVHSVVGSVGKSTVTALCAASLRSLDPTVYIGADSPSMPCGVRVGRGEDAVVETCEYRGEMFHVSPAAILLTNIWPNHEDWFGGGTAAVVAAFERLIDEREPELLVAVTDSPGVEVLLKRVRGRVEVFTVGRGKGDFRVEDVAAEPGVVRFRLVLPDGGAIRAEVPVPGVQGALNAAAALALAIIRGVDADLAALDIAMVELPSRRFEVRLDLPQLTLVDDNARLPQQISATLDAARTEYPGHRLVTVCGFWGRLNPRDLRQTAASLSAADAVLPFDLGGNAIGAGGAEIDDSVDRLAHLLRPTACAAYSDRRLLEELDREQPVCMITLGYDSELPRFRAIEELLLRHLGRSS